MPDRHAGAVAGRLIPVAASAVDQLLFSIAGFALSWSAARLLDAEGLAVFGIGWQWTLGLMGVISEGIVSPVVVRSAASSDVAERYQRTLGSAFLVAGAVALVVATFLVAAGVRLGLALAVTGATCTGGAFTLVRQLDYVRQERTRSITMAAWRVAATAMMLAASISLGIFDASIALVIGGIAFGVSALRIHGRPQWPLLRESVGPLLREGTWYAASTLVRLAGFAGGLMVLVALERTTDDAAVVAGMIILVGPVQLISAGLPMIYLPELARARTRPAQLRIAMTHQAYTVLAATALSAVVARAALPWWAEVTIGDARTREHILAYPGAFTGMIAGIIVTAWLSTALKATGRRHAYLGTSLFGAAVAVVAVFLTTPTPWLAAVPYLAGLGPMAYAAGRRSTTMAS